jgi:hypothetical protein
MKELTQGIARLPGIKHVLILDQNGDTFFSDSLIIEEEKKAMGMFIHFLDFANKQRMTGELQLKTGDWVFDDYTVSILSTYGNILIICYDKVFDTEKLTTEVLHIFDEFN